MTTEVVPALPDRSELRALYHTAIAEINTARGSKLLTTDFYAKTGDAMFDVGCLALSDAMTDTRRMHTVSAPPGGGKTTFSHAFAIALTRYAETNPDALYGVVFVVDSVKKANIVCLELVKHLPGKVAIWTTDHNASSNKEPQYLDEEPAAKFKRRDLPNYPVIVVTHASYLGSQGHYARDVARNGSVRALTIVDEKPEEVPAFEIGLAEAQKAVERLMQEYPEIEEQQKIKEKLDPLLQLMEEHNHKQPNKVFRPGKELEVDTLARGCAWFNTQEARRLAHSTKSIDAIDRLFAFGSALANKRAFIATDGVIPRFFGYEDNLIVNLTAGLILLDATSDIDGVSRIVSHRTETETPKARYDNLEIIHVAQHTKTRLTKYLEDADNAHAYVDWMVSTIREHMAPGEKGLVVCKKSLITQQRVPNWPERDPRFQDKKGFTQDYAWDVEGRKLCVIHWGAGIGRNDWQDADVVFLFDEFFARRGISIARTQGYRGHKAHEGDLGAISSLHSKACGVDMLHEGHVLGWTKQMAVRGRARQYDENGVCGKQRLVVGCDLKRFMLNADRLFPGAKIITVGSVGDNTTIANRILELLTKTAQQVLSVKEIEKLIGKPWRQISSDVLTPFFRKHIGALGWKYEPVKGKVGRGKQGTRFERIAPMVHEGVLSAYMCCPTPSIAQHT
jgi:hypothetical protein